MFEHYKNFYLILFGMEMAQNAEGKEFFSLADVDIIASEVAHWAADFINSDESGTGEEYFDRRFAPWWIEAKRDMDD